jgi:hypothetical protein
LDGFSFWKYSQINNGSYLAKNLTRQKIRWGFIQKFLQYFLISTAKVKFEEKKNLNIFGYSNRSSILPLAKVFFRKTLSFAY